MRDKQIKSLFTYFENRQLNSAAPQAIKGGGGGCCVWKVIEKKCVGMLHLPLFQCGADIHEYYVYGACVPVEIGVCVFTWFFIFSSFHSIAKNMPATRRIQTEKEEEGEGKRAGQSWHNNKYEANHRRPAILLCQTLESIVRITSQCVCVWGSVCVCVCVAFHCLSQPTSAWTHFMLITFVNKTQHGDKPHTDTHTHTDKHTDKHTDTYTDTEGTCKSCVCLCACVLVKKPTASVSIWLHARSRHPQTCNALPANEARAARSARTQFAAGCCHCHCLLQFAVHYMGLARLNVAIANAIVQTKSPHVRFKLLQVASSTKALLATHLPSMLTSCTATQPHIHTLTHTHTRTCAIYKYEMALPSVHCTLFWGSLCTCNNYLQLEVCLWPVQLDTTRLPCAPFPFSFPFSFHCPQHNNFCCTQAKFGQL